MCALYPAVCHDCVTGCYYIHPDTCEHFTNVEAELPQPQSVGPDRFVEVGRGYQCRSEDISVDFVDYFRTFQKKDWMITSSPIPYRSTRSITPSTCSCRATVNSGSSGRSLSQCSDGPLFRKRVMHFDQLNDFFESGYDLTIYLKLTGPFSGFGYAADIILSEPKASGS